MMLVAVFQSGETIPFIITYVNEIIETEDSSLVLERDDNRMVIDDYAYYHAFESENLEEDAEMVEMIRELFIKLHVYLH